MQAAPIDHSEHIKYIKENVSSWKDLSDEDFSFEKFNSYVNKVFKVTSKKEVSGAENPLIFREFGTIANTKALNLFLPFKAQCTLFNDTGACGLGPKCYAHNDKYRIEEFLQGYYRFTYDDVKDAGNIRRQVLMVAKFNKMKVDYMEKVSFYEKFIKGDWEYIQGIPDNAVYLPEHKDRILKCWELFSGDTLAKYEKISLDYTELVPMHNDQNFANIMINKSENKLRFIDYEMARMGLRGEDIGAFIFHSCYSYMNKADFTLVKYPEHYPSEEGFKELATYYIVFSDLNEEELDKVSKHFIKEKKELDLYVEKHYKKEEFEKRVEGIVKNIKIGILNTAILMIVTFIKGYIPIPFAEYFMINITAFRELVLERLKEL